MAKEPAKPLPKPEDVPSAAPLIEAVQQAKAGVAKAAGAATTDDVLDESAPAYRAARKRLKRAQRRLRRELRRVGRVRATSEVSGGEESRSAGESADG
jgi:hypothetical protein